MIATVLVWRHRYKYINRLPTSFIQVTLLAFHLNSGQAQSTGWMQIDEAHNIRCCSDKRQQDVVYTRARRAAAEY